MYWTAYGLQYLHVVKHPKEKKNVFFSCFTPPEELLRGAANNCFCANHLCLVNHFFFSFSFFSACFSPVPVWTDVAFARQTTSFPCAPVTGESLRPPARTDPSPTSAWAVLDPDWPSVKCLQDTKGRPSVYVVHVPHIPTHMFSQVKL